MPELRSSRINVNVAAYPEILMHKEMDICDVCVFYEVEISNRMGFIGLTDPERKECEHCKFIKVEDGAIAEEKSS
jgi:hypothetical protein